MDQDNKFFSLAPFDKYSLKKKRERKLRDKEKDKRRVEGKPKIPYVRKKGKIYDDEG